MKKLISFASSVTLGLMLSVGVVSVSAATTSTSTSCSIYTTGSKSYNSCVDNSTQSARVTCLNNIYVINNNAQNAGTGGAVVSNNTSGGNAVSGNAKNDNNVSVTIGASCAAATVTPTVSVPAQTNPTPTAAAQSPAVLSQVSNVPVGGVHAGGGGAVNHLSAITIAGLVSFISMIVAGVVIKLRNIA